MGVAIPGVVDDEQFGRQPVDLERRQALERAGQERRPPVGGHDHGDVHGAYASSSASRVSALAGSR